jgi:hypothetical protein
MATVRNETFHNVMAPLILLTILADTLAISYLIS